MRKYKEVYNEWFDSEDNVIVVSENKARQLIIGVCEGVVSIGYITNFNGNYDLIVDTQFQPTWNMFTDNDLSKYIRNTQEALYQVMFNLLGCMNNRHIEYEIDISKINSSIDKFYAMCSMRSFIVGLKEIIKSNLNIVN